jgi:hypothetical protein
MAAAEAGEIGAASNSNRNAAGDEEASATTAAAFAAASAAAAIASAAGVEAGNVWVVLYPRNGLLQGSQQVQGAGPSLSATPAAASPPPPPGIRRLAPPQRTATHVAATVEALLDTHREETAALGTRIDRPLPMVAGSLWAARNIPFRVILVVFMLLSLAAVLARAMLAFYVEYVLQPERFELWLGIMLTAELVASALSTPVWYYVSQRWDQKGAWLLATSFAMPVTALAFWTMGAGDILPFTLFAVWGGLTDGGASFLIRSLRTSVIDYDHLFLGFRREAQYLTYLAIFTHWVDIPAAGIGLMALAGAGYVRNERQQNASVVLLLRVLTIAVPLAFVALAWLITFFFPITRANHRLLFPHSSRAHQAAATEGAEAGDRANGGSEHSELAAGAAGAGGGDAEQGSGRRGYRAGAVDGEAGEEEGVGLLSASGISTPLAVPSGIGGVTTGSIAAGSGPGGGLPAGAGSAADALTTVILAPSQAVGAFGNSGTATSGAGAAQAPSSQHGAQTQTQAQAQQHQGHSQGSAQAAAAPANRADAGRGLLLWDPISRAYIYPASLYRAAAGGWLLDHFSPVTLRQVLRYRRHAGGEGDDVDGEADGNGSDGGRYSADGHGASRLAVRRRRGLVSAWWCCCSCDALAAEDAAGGAETRHDYEWAAGAPLLTPSAGGARSAASGHASNGAGAGVRGSALAGAAGVAGAASSLGPTSADVPVKTLGLGLGFGSSSAEGSAAAAAAAAASEHPLPFDAGGDETAVLVSPPSPPTQPPHQAAPSVTGAATGGLAGAPHHPLPTLRRGAYAACICCPYAHPCCYTGVLAREVALTALYTALTGLSVWLIIYGTEPHLETVAWAAMLLFGLAGLAAMYHGSRIRAAARLGLLSSRTIRRYLRLHHPTQ